jgi:hypothetical protein
MEDKEMLIMIQLILILMITVGLLASAFRKNTVKPVIKEYINPRKRKIDEIYDDDDMSEKIQVDPVFKMKVFHRSSSKDRFHDFEGFPKNTIA